MKASDTTQPTRGIPDPCYSYNRFGFTPGHVNTQALPMITRVMDAGYHQENNVSKVPLHNIQEPQDELSDSNVRYRALTESGADIITILDLDGTIRYGSASVQQIVGYTPEEVVGHNILNYVHPKDVPIVVTALQECSEGKERAGIPVRYRIRHKDGSWCWLESVGRDRRGERGIDGFIINSRDVTEVQQAQKALEKAHAQMVAVLESIQDAFFALDKDWNFTYVNAAGERLHGRSREELLGTNIWEQFPEAIGTAFEVNYRKAMNEQIPVAFESFYAPLNRWGEVRVYPSVEGISLYIRDITEAKRAQDTILQHAYYDGLTGLPNRVLFQERLMQALESCLGQQKEAAVLFLDLDSFKHVNDTLGHASGDQLLQTVAQRLQDCLSDADTIARMGGDEFTVLLPCVETAEEATHTARKLLQALEAPIFIKGREIYISGSIGISLFPFDGRDEQSLLRNADIAMYKAKEQGRNNYQLYTEAMNATAFERLYLGSSLRKALEQNEFILYYQPQVDLTTGIVLGVEALIRWRHPDLGLLSPNKFISIAEETGLIIPIGEWVLKEACRKAAKWRAQGHPLRVSVNISARQFEHDELANMVVTALTEAELEPEWLDLELTESTLGQKATEATETLLALKSLGVHLSIDDFGTAYSSLSRLRQFPLDILKLDYSFVQDLTEAPDAKAIVQAIIGLGHALGLEIIAEGVETEMQKQCLLELGCEAMQGYLFSPPVPEEQLEALLEMSR